MTPEIGFCMTIYSTSPTISHSWYQSGIRELTASLKATNTPSSLESSLASSLVLAWKSCYLCWYQWRSKSVVLKFRTAHLRHSQAQLLEFICSYMVDHMFWHLMWYHCSHSRVVTWVVTSYPFASMTLLYCMSHKAILFVVDQGSVQYQLM